MTKSTQLPTKPSQPQQTPDVMTNSNCTASSSHHNKKKKKNKKKSKASKGVDNKVQTDMVDAMMNHHVTRHTVPFDTHSSKLKIIGKRKEDDSFWSSNNNTEERQKIREFWLQLGEEERRSLVKVEKEAVLRKMKEQQKHSCNCSVCGKKRTAIEDELEVLYDAYYEELEQYANHQQQTRGPILRAGYLSSDPMYDHAYDDTDPLDDEEDEDEDEDDEDFDDDIEEDDEDDDIDDIDEDDEDDEDFDDVDDEIITRPAIPSYTERSRFEEMAHIHHTSLSRATANGDHFSFGNSLTVKGGILTVADDLLKNDGKKFLDMMERLAERRMQKEDSVSEQGNGYFQEDDDEDDVYEEEEDEDTRTEEQRMEEGRRMFQIFAARMFEQRVLAAYREKVAQERQQRLLEELEEEDRLREEREAKKQLEREKKKDKKRQLKQQQEAEKLASEAKRKADEEAAKLEKEKKLELERQKREQERLKREEERRLKEEERLRKEEEKKRRAKEEKDRIAERERKRKEKEEKERLEKEKAQKAKAEREEKERLEKEKAQKLKAEKEEKLRLAKEKAEAERKEKERLEKEKAQKLKSEKEGKELLEKKKAQKVSSEKEKPKQAATNQVSKSKSTGTQKTLKTVSSAIPTESSSTNTTTPSTHSTHKIPSPPPGITAYNPITDSSETRQQVLIDALVGSSRPNPIENTLPLSNVTNPLPPPFMSSHLDSLQPPASLLDTLPLDHSSPILNDNHSPSLMGIFNNCITSPLESSSSSTRRSIAPISPIGQPITGRRASSAPLANNTLLNPIYDSNTDPLLTASNMIKRPSTSTPFDGNSTEPRSFFSSFLFGESRPAMMNAGNHMIPNDYDLRFPQQQFNGYQHDRRFSNDAQNTWSNSWTSTSVLSENVHGKLFGNALPDRTAITLERAKVAYQKLNEITQTNIFRGSQQYHTLIQLHCMMNDLYGDYPLDIRALYDILLLPTSGFQCVNHPQHGMIVLHPSSPLSPFSTVINTPLPSNPLQGNNSTFHNTSLFGSMS